MFSPSVPKITQRPTGRNSGSSIITRPGPRWFVHGFVYIAAVAALNEHGGWAWAVIIGEAGPLIPATHGISVDYAVIMYQITLLVR